MLTIYVLSIQIAAYFYHCDIQDQYKKDVIIMDFNGKTDCLIAFVTSEPVLFLRKKIQKLFEQPKFQMSHADFVN